MCTTELGTVAGLKSEFEKRDCKVLGISVDGVSDHQAWSKDIQTSQGYAINYPLIGGSELKVVKLYDMLPADAGETCEGRTPADNAHRAVVFVIGPDKKIKATLTYPMSTGRNFAEILRLLDSCQLTAKQQVATPANWEQGEEVIILPTVSNEELRPSIQMDGSNLCPTSGSSPNRSSRRPRANRFRRHREPADLHPKGLWE